MNIKKVDIETGELVGEKFAKMFYSDIGRLFNLSNSQTNLLLCMVRDCMYGNKISMSPARKKLYVKELGLSSQNSLNNTLKALERASIVQKSDPEDNPYRYVIDPNLFFKGNDYQHAAILTTYSSGSRKVKVLDLGKEPMIP